MTAAEGGGLRHEGDEENFVIMPRPTVRDPKLSLRALGLLTYLVDLPDGWDVNAKRLERQVKEGREAIYSAMRELRAAGYYRVERRPISGGRWVTGTAVAKVARPAWIEEFAEQEAARKANKPEPVPTWEPATENGEVEPGDGFSGTGNEVTVGDEPDTLSEVRQSVVRGPVDRGPVDRGPVHRGPVPLKENPYGGANKEVVTSGGVSHVSRGEDQQPPQDPQPAAVVPPAPAAPSSAGGGDLEPLRTCGTGHPLGQACRSCGDARRAHEEWQDRQLARRRAAEDGERRAARARRRLALVEQDACRLCDVDGTAVVELSEGPVTLACMHDAERNRASVGARRRARSVAELRERYGPGQVASSNAV